MAPLSFSTDVIAAIATPAGRGGIGVIRVSGNNLTQVIQGLLGQPLTARVATLANFRGARDEILDQGLVLHFPAPASYTGEHVLEIHAHGGPAVLALLLQRCVDLGARLAEPGEFTKRAFLNGKIDLAQAEGVADLIEAATATAARAAARSLTGAFSTEIQALVQELIDLRMLTEAALDFPEEDIDFIRGADTQARLASLRARLAGIGERARAGSLLRDGLTVALIGQPNVGKSSLLNQLVGDDLAIVTPHAGTTRDTVRGTIEVAGIPLHIVDTAGLRETEDAIERIGIERTWTAVMRADLALIVTDARTPDDAGDAAIVEKLPMAMSRIVVRNKVDLVDRREEPAMTAKEEVWLSAKTGAGIEALREAILAAADVDADMEGTFIARERHLQALAAASTNLAAAAEHLEVNAPALELFAEELRGAQFALSSITGEFTADDLLGAIFSRFCIGK